MSLASVLPLRGRGILEPGEVSGGWPEAAEVTPGRTSCRLGFGASGGRGLAPPPVKRRPGGELASRTSPGLAPAECGGRLHGVDRPEDGSEDSRRTGILLGCGVAGSCRRGDTRASVVASILASTVSVVALISHCGLMLETLHTRMTQQPQLC